MNKDVIEALLKVKPAPLPVYHGTLLPSFPPLRNGGLEKRIKEIIDFEPRESDVLICGFPKSGNHWILEIVELLLNQNAELTETALCEYILELCDHKLLNDLRSTRILHTHLPYRFLSESQLMRRTKTIVILRNPKDVCVSYYNHSKKDLFINYDITWKEYFDKWMKTEIPYGSWYDYVQEFERAEQTGQLQMLIVNYEDLKTKPRLTIQQIADFLNISYDGDKLIDDIIHVTSFEYMSVHKKEMSKLVDPKGKGIIFRKGLIGDWKNWFTVGQNEQFNQQYNDKMKNSNLNFKFEH